MADKAETRGRPRSPFERKLQIRCTDEQLGRWTDAATDHGHELSSWIRWVLDREAKRKK